MPTQNTTGSRQSTEVHTGGTTQTQTINAEDLSLQLDNSPSSVIYVDIPGCDDKQAAAMLLGKPPLHPPSPANADAIRPPARRRSRPAPGRTSSPMTGAASLARCRCPTSRPP